MTAYPFSEASLAAALGVPVKLLQDARKKMREGEAWSTQPGGQIGFAEAALPGLAKLVTGEKLAFAELAALLEKMRALPPPPIAARVVRLFRNPHVIEMELPDTTRVNVRVRCTDHLRAGEQGTVLLLQRDPDGRYELAQRLPRSRRTLLPTT